jgi:hypothetical protein
MSKIQILNEKQISHYFDVLYPELIAKFNLKKDELKKQAEVEEGNFATHAEVIKLKEKFDGEVALAIKLIGVQKLLKEIDEKYYISTDGWRHNIVKTEEGLVELKEANEKLIQTLMQELSQKNLFVDNVWERRVKMANELRARLSMTAVMDFDQIKDVILKSIDINTFFSTPIINE